MIEVECIEAAVPKLIKEYLKNAPELHDFYAFPPRMNGLKEAAKKRIEYPTDRETLVRVLLKQHQSSSFASKQSKINIERLLQEDCFTITTGHQLGVLGGPLFFFYKILSVVKLCEMAKEEGIEAVPVYWMASEDHDFDEVKSTTIMGEAYAWNEALSGPVGRHSLQGFQSTIAALKNEFHTLPGWDATADFIATLYNDQKTLAEATRDLVYWAFGAYGVVVIDADDFELKSQFKPYMERDFNEHTAYKAVTNASGALEQLGYSPQLTPRPINLFYMLDGYRERLEMHNGQVLTVDGKFNWTLETLRNHLNDHPERFSPNVVLRPMYQEVILPNLSYVGGPGELSYWLQLKPAFEAMHIFFPQVLLRDMVVLLDAKSKKRMEQLALSAEDVYRPEPELLKELLRRDGTHEYLVGEKEEEIDSLLSDLEIILAKFDPSLGESARAEHQRIINRLSILKKKVLRADRKSNTLLERRLREWKSIVYPDGQPQERVLNWMNFYTKDNIHNGLEGLFKHFNTFDGCIRVITTDN